MMTAHAAKLPPLDARLQAVAALVRPGSILADIGADHAYLICHLAAQGRIRHGYACEVNPQPLENARKTIESSGLGDMVEPVLSDGLAALQTRALEEVVMAGMGGELICELLTRASWCRRQEMHFILQPMTRAEVLRRYLCQNGFMIERELAAAAGGFCYTVLSVYYTGRIEDCTELFAHFGKLPENKDAVSLQYLLWQQKRIEDKLQGLNRAQDIQSGSAELLETQMLFDAMQHVIAQYRACIEAGQQST